MGEFASVSHERIDRDEAATVDGVTFHPFDERSRGGLSQLFVALNEFLVSNARFFAIRVEVVSRRTLDLHIPVCRHSDRPSLTSEIGQHAQHRAQGGTQVDRPNRAERTSESGVEIGRIGTSSKQL
jgi:hypothetical protein